MKSNYTPAALTAVAQADLLVIEGGKEGYPDGPVAVTVVGTTGCVLEGQLAAMRGKPDPSAQPKPFHATAVPVGEP